MRPNVARARARARLSLAGGRGRVGAAGTRALALFRAAALVKREKEEEMHACPWGLPRSREITRKRGSSSLAVELVVE